MVDRGSKLKISLTDSELEDALEQLFPRCKPKSDLADLIEKPEAQRPPPRPEVVITENSLADLPSPTFSGGRVYPNLFRMIRQDPDLSDLSSHNESCRALRVETQKVSPLIAARTDRKFPRKMRPKSTRMRPERRPMDRQRRVNRLTRLKELQNGTGTLSSPNAQFRRPLSWDGSESVDSVEFQKFGLSPNYEGYRPRPRNHLCGTVIYDDISENKFRESDSEDESECRPTARRFPRTLGLIKSFSSDDISSLSESGGLTSRTHSEAGTPIKSPNYVSDKQKIIQYDKSPRRYGARPEVVNGVTIYDTSSPDYAYNGQPCDTSPEFSTINSAKPGFAKRVESDNSAEKIKDSFINLQEFEQTEEVMQIQNKPDGSFSLFQFSTSYPQENLSPCELLEDTSLDANEHFVDKFREDYEYRLGKKVGNAYVARRLAAPPEVEEIEQDIDESAEIEKIVDVPMETGQVSAPVNPPKAVREREIPVRGMYPYPDSSDFESEVEVESDSARGMSVKANSEPVSQNPPDHGQIVNGVLANEKVTGDKPLLDPLIKQQMQAIQQTLERTSLAEKFPRAQSEPAPPVPKPSLAALRAMSQPPAQPLCLSPSVTMTALPVQNFGSMPSTYIGPPTNPRPARPNFQPPMANGQLRASFNPFSNQMNSGVPVFPPGLPKADFREVAEKPDYTKQVEQFLKSQSFAGELENHISPNGDGNLIGLSNTPPPPAPMIHRSTTDDGLCRLVDSGNSRCSSSSDRRTSVEAALNDIKQAIRTTKQQVGRPKSLIVNNNNVKADAKSPVWIPRHSSSNSKRYIRENDRNRRKKTKEYRDDDDAESDKLLLDDSKEENTRRECSYYERTAPNGEAKSLVDLPPSRRSKSVTPVSNLQVPSPKDGSSAHRTSPGMSRSKTSPDAMGRSLKRSEERESKVDRAGQKAEENGEKDESSGNSISKKKGKPKEVIIHEPAVLIEGVLFRARYLGSTQLVCEGQPSKATRMMQAEEAVSRIKAPDGEPQPSTEVDLFISTEKIMVLNTELKEIMMDHALRTISYIADIGDLVVLMARRRPPPIEGEDGPRINKTPRMVCHIFESEEAQFIAQSIGQAFQVAYMEFLKANGIEDQTFGREVDYQEVLNSQEIFGDELAMFSRKDLQKEVIVPKGRNEILGVVIVESGWGSMLPTVVIANLMPGGAAARCGQLNIGDQIIAINGISLVGLPLATCQNYIKNAKSATVVKMTVVPCPPVVEVKIKRPDTKYQLGFSVQNGVICSLLRGGIAERGGVRVGHRIIEINGTSVVAVPHERIVSLLATSVGEIQMKTMPTSMFRLLTGQETPVYI